VEPVGFSVALAPDAELREGDPLALVLPRDRLHFFDVASGKRME
jgi:hypothetical protein